MISDVEREGLFWSSGGVIRAGRTPRGKSNMFKCRATPADHPDLPMSVIHNDEFASAVDYVRCALCGCVLAG